MADAPTPLTDATEFDAIPLHKLARRLERRCAELEAGLRGLRNDSSMTTHQIEWIDALLEKRDGS